MNGPQRRARAADAWRESRGELMTDEEEAMDEAAREWVEMEANAPAGIELAEPPAGEFDVPGWANESGLTCECGSPDFVAGMVENGGTQPGTHYGPEIHWFEGWVECLCGRHQNVSDSS